MTDPWPLRSSLELGALSTAVPCACLHVKHVLWEWGLNSLAESAELPADAAPPTQPPPTQPPPTQPPPTQPPPTQPPPTQPQPQPAQPQATQQPALPRRVPRARPKPPAELVTDLDILRRLRDHLMS
jgi:hypothetical protein